MTLDIESAFNAVLLEDIFSHLVDCEILSKLTNFAAFMTTDRGLFFQFRTAQPREFEVGPLSSLFQPSIEGKRPPYGGKDS